MKLASLPGPPTPHVPPPCQDWEIRCEKEKRVLFLALVDAQRNNDNTL